MPQHFEARTSQVPVSAVSGQNHAAPPSLLLVPILFLRQPLIDRALNGHRLGLRVKVHDLIADRIHEEFRKIPRQLLTPLCLLIVQRGIQPQILVDLVAVSAVDVALLKHRELDTLAGSEPSDLLVSTRLLLAELIAGKAQNQQAVLAIFLIHLN